MPAQRKREEELAAPRKDRKSTTSDVTPGTQRAVTIPHAAEWHPIARRLYDSLRTSGQADFWQNSDWMYAWMLCEEISRYQQSEGRARSAMMFQTLVSGLERLLVTEADRRKARIELRTPAPDVAPASVTAIKGYRDRLGVAKDK